MLSNIRRDITIFELIRTLKIKINELKSILTEEMNYLHFNLVLISHKRYLITTCS